MGSDDGGDASTADASEGIEEAPTTAADTFTRKARRSSVVMVAGSDDLEDSEDDRDNGELAFPV
jgi:hypothetical protein